MSANGTSGYVSPEHPRHAHAPPRGECATSTATSSSPATAVTVDDHAAFDIAASPRCRCGHTEAQHTDMSGRSACGVDLGGGLRCGCFGFHESSVDAPSGGAQ